ncbi:armadillo-type protein [Cubamyces menziesii]|nr:armadillo-type protein [Cubamyces menziesii]
MERTLEDQERHLLVKAIHRVLYKLDDLIRPYVHKILVVIEPLLIDEDYYVRLAHMISTMRPDIDHADEYVRNTTAPLGIPSLLPFLKAVCRSKKSWQARHTGIRIVQQIAIMMGCAVLPSSSMSRRKVRTMIALALAAFAEAAAPYETTVELAQKAGVAGIVGRIVNDLKDEAEPYRKMVMETITKVVASLGASDIDERLEVRLVDGIIYAFQEQTTEDQVMLDGFGTVVNALGIRVKPYLTQIVSTILWRLNNKSAKVRQQAADLTTRLAVVIKQCGEDQLLSKLGLVLFEQLGEEYPDTLGSIIAAEGAIANVVGMTQMNPPVKDLLPRMTPILRNRHEKVQEATINLIGRIVDRGAEFVPAREWMRICFELLDLLKAHTKG